MRTERDEWASDRLTARFGLGVPGGEGEVSEVVERLWTDMVSDHRTKES